MTGYQLQRPTNSSVVFKNKTMGIDDDEKEIENSKWRHTIVSILEGESMGNKSAASGNKDGSSENKQIQVKKLRKLALLTLQLDENDKTAKKSFKRTIQDLEKEGAVILDEVGHITLARKKRKAKDEKKSKKKLKLKEDEGGTHHINDVSTNQQTDESGIGSKDTSKTPCSGNPQGVTRLFLGNLPFAVDEASLESFIPGMTHVKWITDKETGKFYGSAFVEMGTSADSAAAVSKAGQSLLGRPIKINFAPALPGDKWPPEKKVVTGGSTDAITNVKEKSGSRAAGGSGMKAMSVKPENCVKLFIGNLSYEIDDDTISKFFASVDAEVKAVRWIHHKDTGDFKGV
jgi:nucleolin